MKYTKEKIEEAVRNSKSIFGVMRHLGFKKLSGGSHSHIKKKIKEYNIDTSHFTGQGWLRDSTAPNKKGWEYYLVFRNDGRRQSAKILRRSLLEYGVEYRCNKCSNTGEWQDSKLVLEINHKNNNFCDDRLENLEFLCPNCHSQLPVNRNTKMVA